MGNRYLYNQIYTATDNAYNFGQSDVTSTAITEGDLGNSSVTWEEAKKFDIGLDFNAFASDLLSTGSMTNDTISL